MTFHIDQVANSYGWNQSYCGEGELVSDKEGGGKEEGEFIPTPTAHPHPGADHQDSREGQVENVIDSVQFLTHNPLRAFLRGQGSKYEGSIA